MTKPLSKIIVQTLQRDAVVSEEDYRYLLHHTNRPLDVEAISFCYNSLNEVFSVTVSKPNNKVVVLFLYMTGVEYDLYVGGHLICQKRNQ